MNKYHTNFEEKAYAVSGRMIVCSFTLPVFSTINTLDSESRDLIKKDMASQLALHLLENDMIEFTQVEDVITQDKTIRGRIFVTPNTDTKLIRTLTR